MIKGPTMRELADKLPILAEEGAWKLRRVARGLAVDHACTKPKRGVAGGWVSDDTLLPIAATEVVTREMVNGCLVCHDCGEAAPSRIEALYRTSKMCKPKTGLLEDLVGRMGPITGLSKSTYPILKPKK